MAITRRYDPKSDAAATLRRHHRHKLRWFLYATILAALLVPSIPVIRNTILALETHTLGAAWLQWSLAYYAALRSAPIHTFVGTLKNFVTEDRTWDTYYAIGGVTVFVLGTMILAGHVLNPHSDIPPIYGDAAHAGDDVIRAIESRKPPQAGLGEDAWLFCLGRWDKDIEGRRRRHRRNHTLKFAETLSAMVMAPPGTYKTAGIIVPSIVLTDGASQIIHDPKKELYQITSAHRAKVSVTLVLDWSAIDEPANEIYHPRWNPISPKTMPPFGDPRLAEYVDKAAQILIPDKATHGAEEAYFIQAARNALVGFIIFLMHKVNERRDYTGIPERWHGLEASLPMLLDWIASAQYRAKREADARFAAMTSDEAAKSALQFGAEGHDAQKGWFQELQSEAAPENHDLPRPFQEFGTLITMPPKQRGAVLSEIDRFLNVFKLPAVQERTAASDFAIDDLRGIRDPAARTVRPITIYLAMDVDKVKTYSQITTLFLELTSKRLQTLAPGGRRDDGKTAGPYPVAFVLDELARLQKCEEIIDGPELARGMKVAYLAAFQAATQIEAVYGKAKIETMFNTYSAKIILQTNNDQDAARYSRLIGKTTIRKTSQSRESQFWKQHQGRDTESYEAVDLVPPNFFMTMPADRQFVLLQGWHSKPLWLHNVPYWKAPETAGKCFNRFNPELTPHLAPSPPMPEWMTTLRIMARAPRKKQRRNA